jgi:hypothetical protein
MTEKERGGVCMQAYKCGRKNRGRDASDKLLDAVFQRMCVCVYNIFAACGIPANTYKQTQTNTHIIYK